MSNTRYIEVDSAYRNRNQWPNPAEFQVLLSQSGSGDRNSSVDPVSKSAILFNWKSNNFSIANKKVLTGFIPGSIPFTIDVANGQNGQNLYIKFTGPVNIPQTSLDYYTGAILTTTSVATAIQRRRIIRSSLALVDGQDTYLIIVVENSFSDAINSITGMDTEISITDSTDLSDKNNPHIFVPEGSWLGAAHGPEAYVSYILYNHTRSMSAGFPVYRKISGYDAFTHLLNLITNETVTETNISGPVTSWMSDDEFIIRQEPPILGIGGLALNNNIPSRTVASLPLLGFNSEDGFYKNSWLKIIDGASAGDTRLITRYVGKEGRAFNGTINSIQLPNNFSTFTGFYNLTYIQITSGLSTGDVRQIIFYDGDTKIATVDSNFTGIISKGDSFFIKSIIVSPPFSSVISSSNEFEILPFSNDNHNSLNYSGSLVSQQEMVCYEIELLNLVLPNRNLDVGLGNRISFYPYVYVEFYNVSSPSSGNKFPIYTNNPNASKAVFRATISDVANPIVSSFIKVDGGGMVQTLKFKPNDNLFFSVKLPNGEIFSTLDKDYVGPNTTRSEVQLSALFGVKRL
tara:strand:- start:61 stop:1776 length:1716 start_codon:yes stop_codon:yes gene_type:complete